jgi:hypothetical protein
MMTPYDPPGAKSVSFRNRFRDFLWIGYYCIFREARGAPWLIPILCACALFSVRALSPQLGNAFVGILEFVAIVLIAFPVGLFLFTIAVYSLASVFSPTGASVSQEQIIALSDDSILVQSPRTQMKISWHEISRLAQTKHYLVVQFHEFAALVIPRRAFQSDNHWQAFYAYCERQSCAA